MSVYLNMKKVILVVFLFLIFILNGNLFSQTVIKMKRDGGVSIIPCKVNGLNLNFIFDTGASSVSLSMTEATFMLKNGYLSESDILGTNKFLDASGKISEGVIINLKEIEIAGLKLYNVKASIVKNNKAPLLLGQSAIGKLGKIQLDFEQNTLSILSGKGSYDFSENSQQNQQSEKNQGIKTKHPVIGKPIIIDNLEIAEYEFSYRMDWQDAQSACASLGDGCRLPTKDELNYLYQNKVAVGGFTTSFYWSSTESAKGAPWAQSFSLGNQYRYRNYLTAYVRAIKSLGQYTASIIGDPITIGNLLIAQNDFPKVMLWSDAQSACASLGDGWRLPTKEELNVLYKNKETIGGFVQHLYWSSTKNMAVTEYNAIWMQYFSNGPNSGIQLTWDGYNGTNYVRAVKSL